MYKRKILPISLIVLAAWNILIRIGLFVLLLLTSNPNKDPVSLFIYRKFFFFQPTIFIILNLGVILGASFILKKKKYGSLILFGASLITLLYSLKIGMFSSQSIWISSISFAMVLAQVFTTKIRLID